MVTQELRRPQSTELKQGGNFYVLRQGGVMATREGVVFGNGGFSKQEWQVTDPTDKSKVRLMRDQVNQLLGIESTHEIPKLISDPEARKQASEIACDKLGKMYGIEGNKEAVRSKIEGYGATANSVINGLINGGIVTDRPVELELSNEVQATNNPTELLLMAHDDRYHKRVRFEAKRKLVLMGLAASIDQREQQTNVKGNYKKFTDFLDEHVWSPDRKRGENENAFLLSTHDPDTFACTSVSVLTSEEAQDAEVEPGQKLTQVKRRRFKPNGHEVSIYAHTREKTPEARILKLLRKGEENPALAVDDEIGFMGVLDTSEDVETFKRHLSRSATRAGSMIVFEEIEDNLNGGEHNPKSTGSSSDVQMFKSFVRIDGMRTEVMLHTNETYLNYRYQKGVAHEEYETKRLFDSGVVSLLFPEDVYSHNIQSMRESAIQKVRAKIEQS